MANQRDLGKLGNKSNIIQEFLELYNKIFGDRKGTEGKEK